MNIVKMGVRMELRYLEQEIITEDRYRRLFECLRNDTSENLHKGWNLNPLGFRITEIKVTCERDIYTGRCRDKRYDTKVKFYYKDKIMCYLVDYEKRPGDLLDFKIPGLIDPSDRHTLFDKLTIQCINESYMVEGYETYEVSFLIKDTILEKYHISHTDPYVNFMIYPTLFYKNKCLNGLSFQAIVKLVGGSVRNINKSYILKEWDEISNFSFCSDGIEEKNDEDN